VSYTERDLPDDYNDRDLAIGRKVLSALRWIPNDEERAIFIAKNIAAERNRILVHTINRAMHDNQKLV